MFKFTINAKELGVIQALDKLASNNNKALSAMSLLLMEVSGQTVRLTASNAEARMTATLQPVEIEGDGTVCVEPKKLGALAKAIGELPVTIAYTDSNVVITSPNGKYGLGANDAEYYPKAEIITGTHFDMQAADLAKGIKSTVFAAASDVAYHTQLQGVQIVFSPDKITFNATDTHLLTQWSITQTNSETAAIVVPTKSAQMIASICENACDEVSLTVADKGLIITAGAIEFTTTLVAGNFPDVERVLPKKTKIEAQVDAATLRTALSRVAILANDRVPSISISIDANGQIRLSTADKDTLRYASETIYGTANDALDVNFDYKVLAGAVSCFTDELVIRANNGASSVLFTPAEDDEKTKYRVLAMPMRVD